MKARVLVLVRSRWSAFERHTRLKAAVLGCVIVMFALVVALILSIRGLAASSDRSLVEAEEWSAAASNATQAGAFLESWSGFDDEASVGLIGVLDELGAQAAVLDEGGVTVESVELAALIDHAGRIIDAPDGLQSVFAPEAAAVGASFMTIAEDLAAAGRAETTAAIGHLDVWLTGIQLVAAGAALVFVVIVATQILPLMRSIQRSMEKLRTWNEDAATETRRRKLSRQVIDGLEVAASEDAAYAVIERALGVAAPSHKAELLLADSSQAHLRAAVVHRENGAPGCGVVSPWSCPAVRRGTTQIFDDSQAIRACPHLSKHAEPCSAVCAPMTFMGEPMGVLHISGPVGEIPEEELVRDISMLAAESATRVGTLRAFARAELQAATDVLTGLPNRRATEDRLRSLLGAVDGGSTAVIEIDGVAALNDRLGRSAGDRALKVASEALTQAVRGQDWCGRWNGAEFVVVLPGVRANAAREIVGRVRDSVVEQLENADLAGLTTLVGIADTRVARTAHGLMGLIGEALSDARGEEFDEFDQESSEEDVESEKILADPRLSTP
jgi:diguanylate cyclase (GGDEF)-like protein